MPNNEHSRPQIIITKSTKNVGLALLLTALFGPLGMLYSTIFGAIVMFVLCSILGFITFGFGAFLLWPICMVWSYFAAKKYNKNLLEHG